MQPDDLRLKDTQDWLARSGEDLRNAEHDLTAVPPFIRDALVHAQQPVEKACKFFLAGRDRPFPQIHSPGGIGAPCALR
jgi:HEPN domain-containing protein